MLKFLDRLAANATSTKWTWRNGALWHVTTYQPNGWEEWKTFDEVARDWYNMGPQMLCLLVDQPHEYSHNSHGIHVSIVVLNH